MDRMTISCWLGLDLFCLYGMCINDIDDYINSNILKLADDTKIYHAFNSVEAIDSYRCKCAFWCSAPAVWNSLPQTLLSSDSAAIFKLRLKTFLSGFLFFLCSLTLMPGPSASEVTTLWRYTNLFIIIIIIIITYFGVMVSWLADVIYDKCKKLNSSKHLVRTTVAGSHN